MAEKLLYFFSFLSMFNNLINKKSASENLMIFVMKTFCMCGYVEQGGGGGGAGVRGGGEGVKVLMLGEKVLIITKTCLYNFNPHKPHFYIVKLGFIGVYIIFLISAQKHRLWVLVRSASTKHRLWYSLEPPRRGGSNEYPQSMFLSRNMKNIRIFYLKNFIFDGKIFSIFE